MLSLSVGCKKMKYQGQSKVTLIVRRLLLLAICIFTLSLSVPAFASPPLTSTVTFYENASGTDVTNTFQTGTSAQDLTLFANLNPAFSNPGHTFSGWNTSPNGGGTSFGDGASYSFASDVSLYAQWSALATITDNFDSNGGAGSITSISGLVGSTVSLPSGAGLTYSGYAFAGWNTSANGSGTSNAPGASIVLNANETFYAQWTALQYVLSFLPDGGTVNPTTIDYAFGDAAVTLPTPNFTNEIFDGWFTTPTGGTLIGLAGVSYVPTQTLFLYAQWSQTSTVQIVFAVNGGSGSAATLSGDAGTSVTLPGSSSLLKSGYTLTSWNTAANGSGTSYAPGQTVTLSSTTTLYAQWKKTPVSVLYGAVGLFSKKTTKLTTNLKVEVRRLAAAVKTKKYVKVTLYGYTAATGVASLNVSLSRARAANVANYLRSELSAMKVKGVVISAAGEGAVAGKTAPQYSRVEVFVS
jgi:uncharacterized repeat protein (TIGR02543 family)